MTLPRVAIVVVTFGHAMDLPALLQSVAAVDYPRDLLEMIIVDNGDGTDAAVARALAPTAQVIEAGENLGFAAASNLGVARADADIILLVNPDICLEPAAIRALCRALAEPQVGIVGGRLLFPDGKTIQHAGGELHLPLGLTTHRGHGAAGTGAYDRPMDTTYVTGALLATRREAWEQLGGLDESFWPAYYEEVDLCLRARSAGLKVRYVPDAVATHREAASLGRTSVRYYRLYHANRLRLLFKHQDEAFLASIWLPAELRHLRTTADDNEIDGLGWSYGMWQRYFLEGGQGTGARIEGWEEPAMLDAVVPGSESAWTLTQAHAKHTITPRPFESRIPGLARLRRRWNSLATEAYLRPILQQQNDFNAALVELGTALERQRRTADAAILCQGMLLARVLTSRHRPEQG
jgi:GT2 family glycosyltransferase